jgi:hypothetical protein
MADAPDLLASRRAGVWAGVVVHLHLGGSTLTGSPMIEADFIIVGTGAGGLSAALHASEHGSVVMITKRKALDSNSNWAQGGIACVTAGG